MKSKIAEAIRMKYSPVALLWADEKPDGAVEMSPGRWGCVMSLVVAASKGKLSAASRETCGCNGGFVGMGFGDMYSQFPGGIEYFLSHGHPELAETEEGRKLLETRPDMVLGERYVKTPELARKFIDALGTMDIPAKYVVFKPIEAVEEGEEPKSVILLVNPDQLSALVVLANYARESTDNVAIPMGAGCHQMGILVYREMDQAFPKAIIGLTDLSARKITDRSLGSDIMSFSVPFKMFQEMEGDVDGSFLQRDTWKEVMEISKL